MAKAKESSLDTGGTLRASVTFVCILALAVLLWYSIHVLLLIFAGILIAILLRGLADFVGERTGLGHKASLAIVITVLLIGLGALLWISASRLITETAQLAERLPAALEQLRQKIAATKLGGMLLSQAPQFNAVMSGRADLLGSVTGVVSGTLGAIVTVIVVLFVGLFLALDPELYVRGVIHLFPRDRRDRIAEVMGATGYTLKWWLIGQAVDMVIVAIATSIGLWLIGVPLALVLGLLAGLFNFIPNFGPLISMIPAVLLALGDDPSKAVYVIIFYIVLQSLEGYILLPWIQRRSVDLPNAMTIVAQVLMGILAGALGLALAAPLAAAALVATKMLYVEDTLGDHIDTPEENARKEVRQVKKVAAKVEQEAKT